MNRINRRQLLKGALGVSAAGGFLGTLGRAAHAQALAESHTYYVFCYFGGGWDTLLGLDPRDPVQFGAQNMRSTRIHTGYELLPGNRTRIITPFGTDFGPFIGNLQRYADRMAIVRGMSMETVSHGTGMRRFITGRQPNGEVARGSSGATWLASKWGRSQIVPNLALNIESYNVDQPTYASALRASGIGDLLQSVAPADRDLRAGQRGILDRFLASEANCEAAKRSDMLQTAETSRRSAREISSGRLAAQFDFLAQNAEMEALRGQFRFSRDDDGLRSANARVALAGQAITNGVSRVVSMAVAGGLDTHNGTQWVNDQGPRQMSGFNAMALLADYLDAREYRNTGTTWLDHTVIMAFSEFCRTPLLNGSSGRDHHITNACMLLGGGLKAGVYGRSSDVALRPQPMNLTTGEVDEVNGVIPKPEHIYQTLLYHAGFQRDDANFGVGPIDAMLRRS